jgi:hypothetical protein
MRLCLLSVTIDVNRIKRTPAALLGVALRDLTDGKLGFNASGQ